MPTVSSEIVPDEAIRARPKRRPVPTTPSFFQFAADIVALAASFGPYYYIRFVSGWFETSLSINHFSNIFVALPAFIALSIYWMVLFWFAGLYKNWYVRSPFDELFTVLRITFFGCCFLLFAILLDDSMSGTPQLSQSRLIIFLYWALASVSLCVGRLSARSLQRSLRERGIIRIPALLIGCAPKLSELWQSIVTAPALGYRPVGVLLRRKEDEAEWRAFARERSIELPVLGWFADLERVLDKVRPQEALVSIKNPDHENLLDISSMCDHKNVTVKIVPDLYEIFSGQARTMQIYGTPLIEVSPRLMKPWEEVLKRILDIVCSILVLALGAPLLLLVALGIKLDSRGPVLFSQARCGMSGRRFTLYKFRSMVTDAEKHGPQWATMNDPRVTRLGRFLRKTHIDEIPQFWNVLKGEMSLVGPRPERPYYVEKFTQAIPYYPRRLKVRPGITGWHQVKYTTYNETLDDVRERLRFDFFYIENMSFKLDLEILVRTVFRVLKGHGQA